MRYLIDTHTFLWFINEDSSLTSQAKDLIEDIDNAIFLSTASLWEMAIKISLKKLQISPDSFKQFMYQQNDRQWSYSIVNF